MSRAWMVRSDWLVLAQSQLVLGRQMGRMPRERVSLAHERARLIMWRRAIGRMPASRKKRSGFRLGTAHNVEANNGANAPRASEPSSRAGTAHEVEASCPFIHFIE